MQEMGDVVAQCLQQRSEDRPTAAHLLKHRFFRQAAVRDAEELVRALWAAVPASNNGRSRSPSRRGSGAHQGPLLPPGMPCMGFGRTALRPQCSAWHAACGQIFLCACVSSLWLITGLIGRQ